MSEPLADDDLDLIDRYWRAANYLTVGQIYLQGNPLLREPLAAEHVKPRLLGHWGTSPGLSLLYTHLNRIIRRTGVDMIFIAGPGHGGPAVVANVWLEGTYSEVYPEVTPDEAGMARLFRQFSTPGGIPSHVSVPTPGSIHEGGELGYALVHAFGAAFDHPDLVVAAVVGDGEAETGPLEGSWKGVRFLNPVHDGAVLPILHLNGYKIAGPTVLGRASDSDIRSLFTGHGYDVRFVEGDDPRAVHRALAATLDDAIEQIRAVQDDARTNGISERPRWPLIVLRTPKGWTGPKEVDGVPIEGTFRAHQVPISGARDDAGHRQLLEQWMRSYRPGELFDERGRLLPALAALAPIGDKRMGATPYANGGRLLAPLDVPDYADYAVEVPAPATTWQESTRRFGIMLRDIFTRTSADRTFRLFCPDETNSNRLGAVFDVENRGFMERILVSDDHVAHDGRVMEVLSEHNCEGWLEGYLLTGRHGLFASYEAFTMITASMLVQHTKWLEAARALPWRASIASLNVLLTSTCWRNDHNGFSHQGPGLIDTVLPMKGTVARIYLPPDANCLLSVADHCLRSRDYVNLIVIDKQPQLQYLDLEAARTHCALGASVWEWASNEHTEPDIVIAAAGDIPTQEALAATWLLRHHLPHMSVRFVNIVDLMALYPPDVHPHGMPEARFIDLFTTDTDVVMAFHGYARAMHQLVHGRTRADRFHVRGFNEEGTTTTPFDMVVKNGMSRYDLCLEALRRSRRAVDGSGQLEQHCREMLERHAKYVVEQLDDLPDVKDWVWSSSPL